MPFSHIIHVFSSRQSVYSWVLSRARFAPLRIYTFERKSIYLDTAYISTPYGKYIDDAYTIVSCEQEAIDLFNSIPKQDPDGLLKWEIDFPKSPDEFTPLVGTSVNVDHEGNINYRYYRKT